MAAADVLCVHEPLGLTEVNMNDVITFFGKDLMKSRYACSLLPDNFNWRDDCPGNSGELIKDEESYFGEWTLLGEHVGSLSAVAIGTVICEVISKEKYDSAVGPSIKLPQEDCMSKDQYLGLPLKSTESIGTIFPEVQIADLEWRSGVLSTDCSEIGLVSCQISENIISFKRLWKARIKQLGRESQYGILYRGVSPDVLMFDRTGHLQIIDFRFGKRLSSERTFTICEMADSLAPEIVQGKGHSFAADWWALGTLIYFMMQAEMPFGSWRESELDTFAKIAKGQLTLPHTFSMVDLITKLLEVDPSLKLGSEGADSVKDHKWFDGVDWNGIKDGSSPVPAEIISRINSYMENHAEDCSLPFISPSNFTGDLNTPEWLEDW